MALLTVRALGGKGGKKRLLSSLLLQSSSTSQRSLVAFPVRFAGGEYDVSGEENCGRGDGRGMQYK